MKNWLANKQMNGNISEPWIRCHNLLAGETQAGSLKFASREGAPTYKANLSSVTAENPIQNKVEIEDHILSWCLNKRGRICWVNLRVSSLSTWPTVWPRAPKPPLISFNKESLLKRCCYSSTPPIARTYRTRIGFLYFIYARIKRQWKSTCNTFLCIVHGFPT